jgi:hypothetical protein
MTTSWPHKLLAYSHIHCRTHLHLRTYPPPPPPPLTHQPSLQITLLRVAFETCMSRAQPIVSARLSLPCCIRWTTTLTKVLAAHRGPHDLVRRWNYSTRTDLCPASLQQHRCDLEDQAGGHSHRRKLALAPHSRQPLVAQHGWDPMLDLGPCWSRLPAVVGAQVEKRHSRHSSLHQQSMSCQLWCGQRRSRVEVAMVVQIHVWCLSRAGCDTTLHLQR